MSWNIWLSGPKELVQTELLDAISTLGQAQGVLARLECPIASVSANGYANSDPSGNWDCSFSGSFTVGGSFPPIPAPSASVNEEAPSSPQPDIGF
jgi:hypothetical protein